jgi:hypothetical protein
MRMKCASTLALFVALATTACNSMNERLDASKLASEKVSAVMAVKNIQNAETLYYAQHEKFAPTLADLGPDVKLPDSYTFTLKPTANGYTINADRKDGWNLFSDESLAIRQHKAPEPATANDPEFGSIP